MVGAHRLLAAEHSGSPAAALASFAKLQVRFRLLRPDAGARQGKAGNDGVGNAAACADAAQDLQGLRVVVLPVGGVFLQYPGYLTGRTGGATEQNGELSTDLLEVVDVPLDVEYYDICVL